MAFSASGFGSAASDFGTAISDFYAASGDKKSAQNYLQAADIANQNAQLAKMSASIQEAATQRQIYKVVGGQASDVAGAGLASSGSAIDIMRDSTRQGALQKAMIGIQGTINSNAYAAQAGAYMGEYQAAQAAAKAATGGGIMNTIGGIASIAGMFAMSDSRVKEGIAFSRFENGYTLYTFRYRGQPEIYEGVIAQEVLAQKPDAVIESTDGFLMVNYGMLGLQMRRVG